MERAPLPETPAASQEFWKTVGDRVTAKVEPALKQNPRMREPLIAYLRDLESVARLGRQGRETIQIIASGRRLLGDLSEVEAPGRSGSSRGTATKRPAVLPGDDR